MDEELKQYLGGMEDRIVERAADPLGERLSRRLDAFEDRSKDWIRQSAHDLATNVIAEFHKYGPASEVHTSDLPARQAITDTALLSERLLAVEDRVSAPERERHG